MVPVTVHMALKQAIERLREDDIVVAGRVTVDAALDLPFLHLDHVLMSQVLANVLENAERLSPDGGVIRVTARAVPENTARVEIAVADDGPGIAGEDRERVFDMFSQNGGGGRAGEFVKMLREKLGVTDDQLEKMKPIFEQQREKLMGLKDDSALTMEQKREKAREIMMGTMEEIKPILTPEQMAKLKEELEKRRAARQQKQ